MECEKSLSWSHDKKNGDGCNSIYLIISLKLLREEYSYNLWNLFLSNSDTEDERKKNKTVEVPMQFCNLNSL